MSPRVQDPIQSDANRHTYFRLRTRRYESAADDFHVDYAPVRHAIQKKTYIVKVIVVFYWARDGQSSAVEEQLRSTDSIFLAYGKL